MKYKNSLKFLLSTLAVFTLAGCSLKQINEQIPTILKNEEVKKEISYKREAVSPELINRINDVISSIIKNDLQNINKNYIHPTFGFYNIYKIDGITTFTQQKEVYNIVDDGIEELSHLIKFASEDSKGYLLKQGDVKFDCSPNNDEFYGWSQDGLYLSSKVSSQLSKIMKDANSFEKDRYKEDDLEKAKLIEKTSYKVVLTPYLVFYMTKIEGKWYLSLFDRATINCSSD